MASSDSPIDDTEWIATASVTRVSEFARRHWDDGDKLSQINQALAKRFQSPAVMSLHLKLRDRVAEIEQRPKPPVIEDVVPAIGPTKSEPEPNQSELVWEWYIQEENDPKGPFTLSELVRLVHDRAIQPETLIWRPGWLQWERARNVQGLFRPPSVNCASDQTNGATAAKPALGQKRAQLGASTHQRTPNNWVVAHWNGELSLPASYWINGAGISILGNLIARSLEFQTLGQLAIFLAAVLAINVWQLVGIWRSADRYNSLDKNHFWGHAAKFAVVLGILLFALSMAALVKLTYTVLG